MGVFRIYIFLLNRKKLKEDPLETFKKFAKKVSQSLTRTHVLLLGRPQKSLINLYAQLTLVWQLVEASL